MTTAKPEMPIPDDLQTWYSVACDGVEFATSHKVVKTLIDRIARLQSELREARRGPCCREPWCGGDCTCEICAPDLAIRDLKAELREARAKYDALKENRDMHAVNAVNLMAERDNLASKVTRLTAPTTDQEWVYRFDAECEREYCLREDVDALLAERMGKEK